MKKISAFLWLLTASIFGASAGELPFTAKIYPYKDAATGDNSARFTVKNDSSEPITGILVTRNNGKTFKYASASISGLNGQIIAPDFKSSSADASGIGYVREYWMTPLIGSMIPPSLIMSAVAGVVPNGRSVNRTGYFADIVNAGDYYSARMHGFLKVPEAGTYRFKLSADDSAYVTLMRKSGGTVATHVLFDEVWGENQGAWHESSTRLTLQQDEVVYLHAFHVEAGGSDYLRLQWLRERAVPSTLDTPAERDTIIMTLMQWHMFNGMFGLVWPLGNQYVSDILQFANDQVSWKGRWYTPQTIAAVLNDIYVYVADPAGYGTYAAIPSGLFSTRAPAAGSTWASTMWPDVNDAPITDNGGPNKSIRITSIAGLNAGNEIVFSGALEEGIDAKDKNYAPQGTLWNLDFADAKTTIQVFGAYGNTSTITLGSTAEIVKEKDYIFKSDARPLKLVVQCVGEDGGLNTQAARFRVKITDPTRESETDKNLEVIRVFDNIASNNADNLEAVFEYDQCRAGMQVTFEAVPESYFGEDGKFVYDTVSEHQEADKMRGVERFSASGLSVNNTPQTGDTTRYSFEMRQDTKIEFRVRHEYALDVASDFGATASRLTTPAGVPWSGPLTSAASGSPDPAAGAGNSVRHWVEANSQVVAQVDAEVQDLAHSAQLLYVRYVPYDYLATGAAIGDVPYARSVVSTNALAEPRLTGVRHQIDFKMNHPGSIKYRWKIQFGVYAQSAESTLCKVLQYKNSQWAEVDPVGAVCWFDQGTTVRVLAAANKTTADSKALSGWMLGDGYYFPVEGTINTDTGEVDNLAITRDAYNNPVAQWLSSDGAAKPFRGMEILNLLRPVAVTWSYGKQVFYDPQLKLGEYMFQGRITPIEQNFPAVAARLFAEPTSVDPPDAAIWDPNAKVLFPVKPGLVKAVYGAADTGFEVHITASWPNKPHYGHIAGSPAVQLTPDAAGSFQFVGKAYAENTVSVVIQDNSLFTATGNGWSLLRFKEIKKVGRADPKEYVALRTVRTQTLQASLNVNKPATAVIGRTITDPLDLAGFGTGFLVYQQGVRYNPGIYNSERLAGLRSTQLYDAEKLKALKPERIIVNPALLPGPVIPVNEYPTGVDDTHRITVVWYDDPIMTDGLLWPHAARRYNLRWPTGPVEGLGRIVIASEWGSESLGADGFDQTIAFATNSVAVAKTFDPSRFTELKVYSQSAAAAAGYNPNEEHALLAPSLRYAAVSPRPTAVYALRAGDLNNYGGVMTSPPYVLVQFYDNVLKNYAMRVFSIAKEDTQQPGHYFAVQSVLTTNSVGVSSATSAQLFGEPHKTMEAGEPVIAFYPIGVVEGAVPCPESTGVNLKGQATFWKDHKSTRWSVSGGTDAWFSVKAFYPLQPDFWWPPQLTGATLMNGVVVEPQVSASVAFLPPNLAADKLLPTRILYKSDWPRIAPVLKAGETMTYSGGEYRADHPAIVVPTADGSGTETIQTPGLPAIVAFAVGEVIFDALNPRNETAKLMTDWTVRVAQVMDSHSVNLSAQNYPPELQPANGKIRQYQGKYIFKDLPASLQKRVRYDPITQKLELRGMLNNKTTDDASLTASPAAVYTLEPNILTSRDVADLYAISEDAAWRSAVDTLRALSLNPSGLANVGGYAVGLQPKVLRDEYGIALTEMIEGVNHEKTDPNVAENARAFGTGLAAIPNGKFLDPRSDYPDVSWVTIAENNDTSMGGSPVALHVIKVDRRERFRGAISVVHSDNVFDENVVLRHTGDFGANGDDLVYEWWYRPDDGALNVPPPYVASASSAGDWKLFPDLSGKNGLARNEILLKGDPNAPETLLADSWWFVRYRHKNDVVSGTDWAVRQSDNSPKVNFEWAGAGNSDPFHDYDLDGYPDYKAQLSMGWIKRVLDAVNPYEARISDFTGTAPATASSMLQQLGPRYEGAVALNPDKEVIENVGLIELYQTILNRAADLSINLSSPVSTAAIANALQLASTRLSDFYMLLGNEAYVDANDPTIGYGSSSVEYGAAAPVVHAFQNQTSSLLEEELDLLRGQDDNMARPVYNRLFWNFTKAEGEAAYAMNYNISDVNMDGFIDEYDAMILYPQGHGDAWGHYLTALTQQYNLLRHPFFNWVSRSEFYNLMNVVMKVDFLDERKFAQVAAQKAKAGAEIVASTYRQYYTEDETAQWQGYTDVNADRAWGVQDWARRAGQGAYFDWVTANALLPAEHPNKNLTGVQKVDRQENADIRLISANLNAIQNSLDDADSGFNPLGISSKAVPFDINPYSWEDGLFGRTHFEQVYDRAIVAINNAKAAWDAANAAQNRLRAVANTEQQFRNDIYQQDITYRNELIEIFGRPYPGTVGSGKFYPDGYIGPDLAYYMYVAANSTAYDYFPKPLSSAVEFDSNGKLSGGTLYEALKSCNLLNKDGYTYKLDTAEYLNQVSMLFGGIKGDSEITALALSINGLYDLSASDFTVTNPLEYIDFELPVTASTYSLVAPSSWGDRPAVGELQQIIAEMLQQQIDISSTFGAYQDMFIDIVRAINLLEIQRQIDDRIAKRNQDLFISKSVINSILLAAKTLAEIMEESGDQVTWMTSGISESLPATTPTLGLANSLGDVLAPARGALKVTGASVSAGLGLAGIAAKIIEVTNELIWEITEGAVELVNADDERLKSYIEGIAGIDDMLDEEGDMRAAIFSKSELLRSLVERYRSTLSRGAMLMDEREAFNRRVAAMVQQNRYQDMTFRVERNHALQNYHRLLDIAARYTYLAAKTYDYETNLMDDDPGSPSVLFEQIAKERTLGYIADGQPQIGAGLAGVLAQLATNYDVMKHRLGLTNPQIETGKLSLRTENFRIFPSGYTNATGASTANWTGDNNADDNWRQTLQKARVKDLWQVPEFRYLARPFGSGVDAHGAAVAEPGIVLRFATQIKSGNNVFGKALAGGDHAWDPSVYATRIRSVGVWFSGYLAEDVLADLSATPRVYLIPTGADVMSVPNAVSPNQTRVWNVLDQVIPIPIPGIESKLPYSNFVPLLDSLDGRIGQQRRFSSFRAYHDSGTEAVNISELVSDSRLVGRSVWNTGWILIIPGRALNADPDEGVNRFIEHVKDIKLVFETYGFSGN